MPKFNFEITVTGRVQGVGFRYFAKKLADQNHITGYVRNVSDRKVFIVAEGELEDLKTFADHMKIGPPMARVIDFTVSKSPFTGSYTDFVIRY